MVSVFVRVSGWITCRSYCTVANNATVDHLFRCIRSQGSRKGLPVKKSGRSVCWPSTNEHGWVGRGAR